MEERILGPEVLATGVFTTTKLCDLGQVTYLLLNFSFFPWKRGIRKLTSALLQLLLVYGMALDVGCFP